MAAPDVREKLLGVGMEPATNTPEQFADFIIYDHDSVNA